MNTHGLVRDMLLVLGCLGFAALAATSGGQALLRDAGQEYLRPAFTWIGEIAAEVFDAAVVQHLLDR